VDKALVRPAAFYAEHGIQTVFGIRATRIDPLARVVELEDQGALHGRHKHPGVLSLWCAASLLFLIHAAMIRDSVCSLAFRL
jgi:hypothetical protein